LKVFWMVVTSDTSIVHAASAIATTLRKGPGVTDERQLPFAGLVRMLNPLLGSAFD
jgi:hypothetical protein